MFVAGYSPLLRSSDNPVAAPGSANTRDPITGLRATATYPPALPCRDYYAQHPEKIGPTGNVVIADAEEWQAWLLVGSPVSPAYAEKMGGCVCFDTAAAATESQSSSSKAVKQVYLRIEDSDDAVYGRAAYLPRVDLAAQRTKQQPISLPVSNNSSRDDFTAEADDAEEEELVEECVSPFAACRSVSIAHACHLVY